jgi:thiamine-monophosphate kinase
MNESAFIASMRAFATNPAARGLLDDAAVLEIDGARLVVTHDMIVEGAHFLPEDPPADVAWKLVAVNLSDLAAKGARPIGALLGYALSESDWDAAFARGLGEALATFGLRLLGGDTVSTPAGAPRTFGLTAIGEAAGPVPSRSGAKAGDILWVSGTIGDAGAGLAIGRGEREGPTTLVERYRRPQPRLEAGQALAPLVTAMMDISDGLLLDASRLAETSGVAALIDLALIPLSSELAALGDAVEARLAAATAGDDYELLFAAPPARTAEIEGLSGRLRLTLTRIGSLERGTGLALHSAGEPLPLPARLGYQHG